MQKINFLKRVSVGAVAFSLFYGSLAFGDFIRNNDIDAAAFRKNYPNHPCCLDKKGQFSIPCLWSCPSPPFAGKCSYYCPDSGFDDCNGSTDAAVGNCVSP